MPDGNIGDRNDLDSTGDAEMPQRFAGQSVLNLIDVIDQFGLVVLHPNLVIDDRRVHIEVHVLINCHSQNESAVLAVEGGQVCSASPERYAERSPGNDHVRSTYEMGIFIQNFRYLQDQLQWPNAACAAHSDEEFFRYSILRV